MKAFDSVNRNRNILWSKLGGLEIDNYCKMLNALESLNVDVQSSVRVNRYHAECEQLFNTRMYSPPLLFSLYIYIRSGNHSEHNEYRRSNRRRSCVCFTICR